MKLKASTLIESLIAMVILVIVLGISTLIYTNILNSDTQSRRLKAISLSDAEIELIWKEKRFVDFEHSVDEWNVISRFEKHPGSVNLYHFKLSVVDEKGVHIIDRHELIFAQ